MNLLDEEVSNNKGNKTKNIIKIIIVFIVLIVIVMIGILSYMMYLEGTVLRVYVNGVENAEVKNLLDFEQDETIYVPVRAISTYLGYNSYSGEYSNKSEDNSKCYVECEGEVVNITLNSNKIYKLNLEQNSNNYTYIYMDKPVKAINGELYITTDGMQKVFNTTFYYDQQNNNIAIYTIPYLISSYKNTILDYGYTRLSEVFENEKAVIKDMLIASDDRYYGVINPTDGTKILECKYDDIRYQESTGDFIVKSGDKYGIIGTDKRTKVDINYDSIELMDYDAGLYLVRRNNRYGVVDLNGNNIIYAENDQIGIDISRFEENDLKTGYILVDNLIPVKKNNKWGLFDTKGKQVVDFEYDSFGYIASSNREATNLLVIPDYNVIVACLNDRYTLLNASGEQPIRAFVDDIYMVISGGKKQYLMTANDKTYDVEEYLDRLGVLKSTSNDNTNTSNNNTTTTNNQNNQVNNETTEENNEQNNGQEQSNEEQQNNGEEQNNQEQQSNEEGQNGEEQQGNG